MKIIKTDLYKLENNKKALNDAVVNFNLVLNTLNELGLGINIKTEEHFAALVRTPNEFIKETLLSGIEAQTISVFGIKLKTKPAKLLEMVELPDTRFLIDHCKACAAELHLLRFVTIMPNKISASYNSIQLITEECSVIAKTPAGIKASEALDSIVAEINKYNVIARANDGFLLNPYNLTSAINLNSESASVNIEFLYRCGLFK